MKKQIILYLDEKDENLLKNINQIVFNLKKDNIKISRSRFILNLINEQLKINN